MVHRGRMSAFADCGGPTMTLVRPDRDGGPTRTVGHCPLSFVMVRAGGPSTSCLEGQIALTQQGIAMTMNTAQRNGGQTHYWLACDQGSCGNKQVDAALSSEFCLSTAG